MLRTVPTYRSLGDPGVTPLAGQPASERPQTAPRLRQHRFFGRLTLALFLFASWHAFMPNPGGGGLGQMDKLMHAAAFLSLAASGALAQRPNRRNTWRLAAALLVYGALIEVAQIWIPGRDASGLDLLADVVGMLCGLAMAWVLQRWGPLRSVNSASQTHA